MKNNPYIGPRPYERGDRQNFFGRDRDARDLLGLILAEREVLFYAQSGAGKTSLLNAQVIPTLEEEGFSLLPVTRVGSSLPPGLTDAAVPNIFVMSALIGLAGADVPIEALPQHTLLSFLREYHLKPPATGKLKPPLLILDQFEELFTSHQDRWNDAEGFFQQVRELLDAERNLGIVLAMREDHVAEIDPFVRYLPRRLAARYRMERLRREEALEAVIQPAVRAGCKYAPGVAERLVNDLSRIRVQRRDEAEAEVPGPVVEPVQLQVVCQRLWENLPEGGDQMIEWDEISQFGSIDRALTDFYETAVTQAMTSGVSERQLRRWFATQLITPHETRGLALRGEAETAGLPNGVVDMLENRHVIRAEVRAGSIWYELSHDRLVQPIVQSNRAWEAARQTPLRSAAQQWQQTKSAGLLYRDKALKDALAWVKDNRDEVEPYEQSFLEASQQAQAARARRRRLLVGGAAAAIVIVLAMAMLTMLAVNKENEARAAQAEAEAQSQIAASRQLAAQANSLLTRQYDLAALLGVEAFNITDTVEARGALLLGFQDHPYLLRYLRGDEAVSSSSAVMTETVTAEPTDCNLAVALMPNDPTVLMLTNKTTGQAETLSGHNEWVYDWTSSPDCRTLTSADESGLRIEWILPAALTRSGPITSTGPVSPALGVDISRYSGTVDWKKIKDSGVSFAFIRGTALSKVDETFERNWRDAKAAGVIRGTYSVFEPSQDPRQQAAAFVRAFQLELGDLPPVLDLERDGGMANEEIIQRLEVWLTELERQTGRRPIIYSARWFTNLHLLDRHRQYPSWFSNYPLWIADYQADGAQGSSPNLPEGWPADWTFWQYTSAGKVPGVDADTDLNLFNGSVEDLRRFVQATSGNLSNANDSALDSYQQIGQALSNSAGAVSTLAFSRDNQTLAVGSADGSISLWNVDTRQLIGRLPKDNAALVRGVAFSPDGKILATTGNDQQITLWDVATRQQIGATLGGYTDSVNSLAFSPAERGRMLASGSCSGQDSSGLCTQGEIRLWDVTTGELIGQPWAAHADAVFSVAFSPDGRLLASGGGDGTIELWDAATRRRVGRPLTGHTNSILSLAFSPDSKILASGSQDKTIRMWDVITTTPALIGQPLSGHTRAVNSIAFDPGGKILASGSWDKSIILWNVATHQPIGQPLTGHTDIVNSIAFSPNGDTLAAGGWDNRIILWNVNPVAWQVRACEIARRNLTRAEWQIYMGDKPYRKTCAQWPAGQ